jgi:ABC-2 type transport system ATP-binding protein
MLSISHLLDRPVRVLSLGERMRAGLACSLIYYPQVLFLDEPTIGLDVSAITMMRQFIADYTAQSGATVVLTSHYMADVQSLCKRVILINEGSVTFDGSLQSLGDGLVSYKMIRVPTERISAADLSESEKSMLMSTDNGMLTFRVPKERIAATASRLLTKYGVDDISIEEPPLELLMDQIYREGI